MDGTLLEFADRPEAVSPTDGLTDILLGLQGTLGGALALISGRTIEELDRIFNPVRLPIGGQHGLERRDAKGRIFSAPPAQSLDEIRSSLKEFADQNDGTLLEDKGAGWFDTCLTRVGGTTLIVEGLTEDGGTTGIDFGCVTPV